MAREQPDSFIDLLVSYQNEIVEQLPKNLIRQFKRNAGGQALMHSLHRRIRIQSAFAPGVPQGGRGFRLNGNYSNPLVKLVRDDAIAGSATTAARGSDDHIDVRQVFENLEPNRADSGNQLRLVRRVDVT